jgi:hypothetical protein
MFPPPLCWDIETAELFDEASQHVRPRTCSGGADLADPGRHADWLNEYAELGFDASTCTTSAGAARRSSTSSARRCCRSCR